MSDSRPAGKYDYAEALAIFADRIRRARLRRGWSKEQVAHLAGVSVATYAAIERRRTHRGDLPNPSLETVLSILWALDLETDPRRKDE
jgi:transcriptional regulator with XRE-family HTH domain